jgi:hypothetical protein
LKGIIYTRQIQKADLLFSCLVKDDKKFLMSIAPTKATEKATQEA